MISISTLRVGEKLKTELCKEQELGWVVGRGKRLDAMSEKKQ